MIFFLYYGLLFYDSLVLCFICLSEQQLKHNLSLDDWEIVPSSGDS